MKVEHYTEIPEQKMDSPGAEGATVRWLIGKGDDPPNFYMRQFEVAAGGCSPRHAHDYEHEVYVLDGEGVIWSEDGEKPLRTGTVALVVPGEKHQFRNTGSAPLRFLCMIPKSGA